MIYEIKNTRLSVKIDSLGAEMQSIQDHEGTEYLWQGDSNTWPEQAPNLFPYIARLTDGKFQYQNQMYEMKIHGFAKYMEMEVVKHTKEEITFQLVANAQTQKQYPFLFTFSVNYHIQDTRIVVTYHVENRDEKNMYFGIGGHPGFRVPMEQGLCFADYQLTFSEKQTPYRIGFTEDCYLNGEKETFSLENDQTLQLSHNLFDDDAIVLEHMAKSVTIHAEKGTKQIKVSYPDMDYLGIWHWPRTEVDYVCIEPWSSLPSRKGIIENLEEQKNLIALDAGKTYTNTWEIEIIEQR